MDPLSFSSNHEKEKGIVELNNNGGFGKNEEGGGRKWERKEKKLGQRFINFCLKKKKKIGPWARLFTLSVKEKGYTFILLCARKGTVNGDCRFWFYICRKIDTAIYTLERKKHVKGNYWSVCIKILRWLFRYGDLGNSDVTVEVVILKW